MNHTLEIRQLTKKYKDIVALDEVNLTFDNGIYGLLGHNGAGKSTLLNIITTTLGFDEGEVLFDGEDIRKMGKRYRASLGFMPQQQILNLDMNVESFMYYMCAMKEIRNPKEKVMPLLEKLNLKKHRKKRVSALSGGMKQRLLIGQALLNDPKILLLDEPTAGLDPVERVHLREIIADIAEDKIILIATHVISDVELIADQIVLMKNGKVLTVDNQKSLLEKTHVYLSDKSPEELRTVDPSLKMVNRQYINGVIRSRFISSLEIGEPVASTLDDVYLEWLG